MKLNVKTILRVDTALTEESALKVFDKLIQPLKDGKKVQVAFEEVNAVSSVFVGTIAWNILQAFGKEILRKKVTFTGVEGSLVKMTLKTTTDYWEKQNSSTQSTKLNEAETKEPPKDVNWRAFSEDSTWRGHRDEKVLVKTDVTIRMSYPKYWGTFGHDRSVNETILYYAF